MTATGQTRRARGGFTLIELLVSMAILTIIVSAVGQLFNQSTVAWDSGWQRSQVMLVGRAVLDFISAEVAMTVDGATPGQPPDNTAGFTVLDGTNGFRVIRYRRSGRSLERSSTMGVSENWAYLFESHDTDPVSIETFALSFDMNEGYAQVGLGVRLQDKNVDEVKDFKARIWLPNKDRYIDD